MGGSLLLCSVADLYNGLDNIDVDEMVETEKAVMALIADGHHTGTGGCWRWRLGIAAREATMVEW